MNIRLNKSLGNKRPQKLNDCADETLLWIEFYPEKGKQDVEIWKAEVLKKTNLKEFKIKQVYRALQVPAKIEWGDIREAIKQILHGIFNERYVDTGSDLRFEDIIPDEVLSKIYNLLEDCTWKSGCYFKPDVEVPIILKEENDLPNDLEESNE